MRQRKRSGSNPLLTAERECRYPEVAQLGRVIDADTRLVVVHRSLRDRISARERVPARDVLAGSVQIWAKQIELLRIDPLLGRGEIYWWPYAYDPAFLGYMEGVLDLRDFVERGGAVF